MQVHKCLMVAVVLCAWSLAPGEGAKILGLFPMPAPSHFTLGSRLLKELAARGHEVTMISSFPLKKPMKNYRDIPVTGLLDMIKKDTNMFDMEGMWVAGQIIFVHTMGLGVCNATMNEPAVRDLVNSNEKFDLVIAESFLNEAHIGFSHRFDCPFILLSTLGSSVWTNGLVGNPAPASFVPDVFLDYPSEMTFWQRVHNLYHGVFIELFRYFYYFPKQEALLRMHFKETPSLDQMLRNKVSLILLNSHPVINDPVPHVPAMVEIGGYHVEAVKPLPQDLKEYMDSAKDGVILFSMGSNLKSTDLPAVKRDAILKAFSKLKQKVLWKWEDDVLPGQPANVKLSKWLPQNDIMAHPNLRAFITHGGLLSTTEAVYHGVPVVGIPIFGDQKMNIAKAVHKGYGLAVFYDSLNEENFSWALNEIINNPKYRNNVKQRSLVLRDQPIKPIDSAVFWIEHVIRHKGADYLRSASMKLEWYQLYMFDIFALIALKDLVFVFLFVYFVKRMLCKKKQVKKDTKKDAKKDAQKKKN